MTNIIQKTYSMESVLSIPTTNGEIWMIKTDQGWNLLFQEQQEDICNPFPSDQVDVKLEWREDTTAPDADGFVVAFEHQKVNQPAVNL